MAVLFGSGWTGLGARSNMNVNISDKKEQRKFGLLMAIAIAVLGLIRWWWHGLGPLPLNFFYVAAAFAILGLIVPGVLKPVFFVWIRFSIALNWVVTRVLLTLAFFLMIVPTRIILRLAGKDPLNRAWRPEGEVVVVCDGHDVDNDSRVVTVDTYWEEPEEQPTEFERYLNQF